MDDYNAKRLEKEIGRQEGLEAGSNNKAKEIATAMLQASESMDKICLYTGLSEESSMELKKIMENEFPIGMPTV